MLDLEFVALLVTSFLFELVCGAIDNGLKRYKWDYEKKNKMIKLISHYHYRIDVFKEVKCIDFKVYVKIHVKKKV